MDDWFFFLEVAVWHKVSEVAKSRRLNAEKTMEFAKENADDYSIIEEYGTLEINTWHINEFVDACIAKGYREPRT